MYVWTTRLDLLCISSEREPINSDLGWWFSLNVNIWHIQQWKSNNEIRTISSVQSSEQSQIYKHLLSYQHVLKRRKCWQPWSAPSRSVCEARRGVAAHWLNDYAIDTWMIGRALPTNSCNCFLMRTSSPLPTCGTLDHCPVTDHQVPRRAYWTITS